MAVGCVTWILALLAVLAVLASVKGQTGLLLLLLLLALVFWRITEETPPPPLSMAELDTDPGDPPPPTYDITDPGDPPPPTDNITDPVLDGDLKSVTKLDVCPQAEPIPAGGEHGYSRTDHANAAPAISTMSIPLFSTKDDPLPTTEFDKQIYEAALELGKTNLPLPSGQARKEFTQFRMRDVCNKKNRWMIPAKEQGAPEDPKKNA